MIILTNRFKKELGKIVGFIKKDSKTRANLEMIYYLKSTKSQTIHKFIESH
ncbi:hypothetical protein [Campylobacter ureolyticus]|uniref:hypothetical protein n=1 Tax=Campylobacter ureolyticus TaxID=827 RepID=UPI0022B5A5FC|nr:hypothetical protein [Campylobacter ureolyticus]MCZ6110624.1 hypothetical protein [Campylobacter ureolyticus]MCZ6132802.1 hypothetical protein [Campylobacter ureolyticus]MDK8323052.1 hypothetical protein [Campylobacter ureolyticus]